MNEWLANDLEATEWLLENAGPWMTFSKESSGRERLQQRDYCRTKEKKGGPCEATF